MPFLPRLAFAPLAALAVIAGAAEPQKKLLKDSPFTSAAQAAGPAQASETIEFAGVMVGKKTDLIFYDKTAKKSHWIGVGETKEGIAVVNYDARREQAIVRVNGTEKVLPLRKASAPGKSPAPVAPMPTGFNVAPAVPAVATLPAPHTAPGVQAQPMPAPAQPGTAPAAGTPEVQQKQETEARMLVSDLLEIGMAQRRAYEEAQRRAAEGNAQTPPGQTPNAQPQPPKQ